MHQIERTIQTRAGEVLIRLQDRNLIEVASLNPLNICGTAVHVWVILERICGVWGVSGYGWSGVYLAGPAGLIPAAGASEGLVAADEASTREALSQIVPAVAKWAASHPEAFEHAARQAFKLDKEGLWHELEDLRESLHCAAEAVESLASEAHPDDSLRLREHSRAMRGVARSMPALRKLTHGVLYAGQPAERSAQVSCTASADSSVLPTETVSSTDDVAAVAPRAEPKNQTLGECLKQRREALGLTQRELALRLGLKPRHVADLENGPSRPSFMLLGRVAEVLGFRKEELFLLVQPEVSLAKSRERKACGAKRRDQVWKDFTSRKALLERHQVKPRELKVLSHVNLLGKISSPRQFLFILKAIRKARNSED